METWRSGPLLRVGGVVAIAFVDESHVAVGSHSGLGVFDVQTGALVAREPDAAGNYAWYQADPPAVRIATAKGVRLVPAAGLWGGSLTTETEDGWLIRPTNTGALVEHREVPTCELIDSEEPRAFGFSADGSVAVLATSSTVQVLVRASSRESERAPGV